MERFFRYRTADNEAYNEINIDNETYNEIYNELNGEIKRDCAAQKHLYKENVYRRNIKNNENYEGY